MLVLVIRLLVVGIVMLVEKGRGMPVERLDDGVVVAFVVLDVEPYAWLSFVSIPMDHTSVNTHYRNEGRES